MYNKTKIISTMIAALWAAIVVGTVLNAVTLNILVSGITLVLFVGSILLNKKWHTGCAMGLVVMLVMTTYNVGLNLGAGIAASILVLLLLIDLRKKSKIQA